MSAARHRRGLAVLLTAVCLWPALTAAGSWRANDELRVGVRENAAPLSFRTSEGQFTGYSVEFCGLIVDNLRRLAKRPALRVRYVALRSVDDALRALESGDLDLECGATVVNEERRRRVEFTVPHFYSVSRFIAPADLHAARLEQLGNKRVAVVRGSATAARLAQRVDLGLLRINLVQVATAEEGLALLQDRKTAAFANFEAQLSSWRASLAAPDDYRIGAEVVFLDPVAVALRPNDPTLKRLVDTAVAHAMLDGHVTRLYRRWFQSSATSTGVNLDLPMPEILHATISVPSR